MILQNRGSNLLPFFWKSLENLPRNIILKIKKYSIIKKIRKTAKMEQNGHKFAVFFFSGPTLGYYFNFYPKEAVYQILENLPYYWQDWNHGSLTVYFFQIVSIYIFRNSCFIENRYLNLNSKNSKIFPVRIAMKT